MKKTETRGRKKLAEGDKKQEIKIYVKKSIIEIQKH